MSLEPEVDKCFFCESKADFVVDIDANNKFGCCNKCAYVVVATTIFEVKSSGNRDIKIKIAEIKNTLKW